METATAIDLIAARASARANGVSAIQWLQLLREGAETPQLGPRSLRAMEQGEIAVPAAIAEVAAQIAGL